MELPKFKLARVMDDGTGDKPKVFPVEKLPWETATNRRGFLGAGLTGIALLAAQKISAVIPLRL